MNRAPAGPGIPPRGISARRRAILLAALLAGWGASPAVAHPLGNFSVNRWAALRPDDLAIAVDYVVDFAEIPTFQEVLAIDTDGDGRETDAETRAFASARAASLVTGLVLEIDRVGVPLRPVSSRLVFAPGAGGLQTMKIVARFSGRLPGAIPEAGVRVAFRDLNFAGRAGWREVIASGTAGTAIVGSSVPASDRSRALSSYPSDLIQAPPQDSQAEFRLLTGGAAARARLAGIASPGAADLQGRTEARRPPDDGFAGLIGPQATRFGPGILVAALASAFFWGAAHALTPGHGKTIVAAYLVGRRGIPLHAAWLGIVVTLTHTAGVFALGAVTLLLSRTVVPETLYPWLGFASGLSVTAMGGVLLWRRLWGHGPRAHVQAHGPDRHTHEMPETLTFRGLVALGVAGGIVPCPSAVVVLLSALAINRVLFGMALIAAFSAGIAGVLVAVGLLMVYARGLCERRDGRGRLAARLGVVSAATVLALGIGIAARSLPPSLAAALASAGSLSPLGATLGVLGLGLLFGLKHATEADHLAAVGSMVSEQAGVGRALLTGGLWGAGHTLSILVAGCLVLGLHLTISENLARRLETGVALMIIGLGGSALARALRARAGAHAHGPGLSDHAHLHVRDREAGHRGCEPPVAAPPTDAAQAPGRVGLKPLLVGMMHGLAGSAALTLLVLAQIRSLVLGMIYLAIFGAGSIGGMILMSAAISVPFRATAGRPALNRGMRLASGASSLAFGVCYLWARLAA